MRAVCTGVTPLKAKRNNNHNNERANEQKKRKRNIFQLCMFRGVVYTLSFCCLLAGVLVDRHECAEEEEETVQIYCVTKNIISHSFSIADIHFISIFLRHIVLDVVLFMREYFGVSVSGEEMTKRTEAQQKKKPTRFVPHHVNVICLLCVLRGA